MLFKDNAAGIRRYRTDYRQEMKDMDYLAEESRTEDCLLLADAYINRKYMHDFDRMDILPLTEEVKRHTKIHLLHLKTLVYDMQEDVHDKLVNLYSAFMDEACSLALIVDSNGGKADIYLAVAAIDGAAALKKTLDGGVIGNFQGTRASNVSDSAALMDRWMKSGSHVSGVSIIPSMKKEENRDQYVQGLEKLIVGMGNREYTAVILAVSFQRRMIEEKQNGLEAIYSGLSIQKKTTMTAGVNLAKAMTSSVSEGVTDAISKGISKGYSNGETKGTGTTYSTSRGTSWNLFGFGMSRGSSTGKTTNYSSTDTVTDTFSSNASKALSHVSTKGETNTAGVTNSIMREYENKSVEQLMERLESQLSRLDEGKNAGLWECAAYFISSSSQVATVGANMFRGLMTGKKEYVDDNHVFTWLGSRSEDALASLRCMKHPAIRVGALMDHSRTIIEERVVNGAALVTGFELPILMHLPESSVSGLEVLHMADFSRNIISGDRKDEPVLSMGRIYAKGYEQEQKVPLLVDLLTAHSFITGTTGSGKSHTIYKLVEELLKVKDRDIHFLVMEPAKGEYRRQFGKVEGINIFTTNPQLYRLLKINPFVFHPEIHVLEHLDRIIDVFSACWPLYAAMPAVLKKSFERAYITCGWDLNNSVYIGEGEPKFPDFCVALDCLRTVIKESDYSAESKSNYSGALCTRVESLTNGIFRHVFSSARLAVSDEELFDKNAIVDLSRIGSQETKALIMGLLVIQLKEYRMCQSKESNQKLKHVTILEEAHNLLKRVNGGGNAEGSNIIGQSVEMISNLIAEVRSSGEGFVIVDQTPSAVDSSAIKNTNTKILMCLPDKDDCETAGKSVGLTDAQIFELSKLGQGVAVIKQSAWREAVLAKIGPVTTDYFAPDQYTEFEVLRQIRGKMAEKMLEQYKRGSFVRGEYYSILSGSGINSHKKAEYRDFVSAYCKDLNTAGTDDRKKKIMSEFMMEVLVCSQLFELYPVPMMSKPDRVRSEYGEITPEDIRSAKSWKKKLVKGLNAYGEFADPAVRGKIVQLLILNKRLEKGSRNLAQIQYILTHA